MPEPRAARLPNGLGVWVRARLQACDGVDFKHAAAVAPVRLAPVQPPPPGPALAPANTAASPGAAPPAEATLDGHSRQLIETTLAACGGNIAKAARTLGVSRGMLYRRLHGKLPAQN